jgi:hypothetical protein
MTIRGCLVLCFITVGVAGCFGALAGPGADAGQAGPADLGCGPDCGGDRVLRSACLTGTCQGDCAPGFADCNGDRQLDGCEVDTIHHTEIGNLAVVPAGCRVRCGAGPDCGWGQICRDGACVCDHDSCNGCCQGNRCISEEDSHCGRGGAACVDCTRGAPFGVSDFCADGTCHCSGLPIAEGPSFECLPGSECVPHAGCACTAASCLDGCRPDGSCAGRPVQGHPLPAR